MITAKDNSGVAACLACAQVRLDLCAFVCLLQFVSVVRLLLFALIHHDEKESDNETD